MSNIQNLIPSKEKHSITEAILTVFLVNPIVDPRRFQVLIKEGGSLNDTFQHFKVQQTHKFSAQIKISEGPKSNIEVDDIKDTGFIFESFNNGSIDWVVKYDFTTGFNSFSIHCFQYSRWEGFIAKAIDIIKKLAFFEPSLYVRLLGLTYVDEFHWTSEEEPEANIIFKENNDYIPKIIFKSHNDWLYNCNHQSKVEQDLEVFEYINIVKQKLSQNFQVISIKHNTGYTYTQPFLITEESINQILNIANRIHNVNKDFLAQCLQQEILTTIGLNNKDLV